jgi:hypothetical protein
MLAETDYPVKREMLCLAAALAGGLFAFSVGTDLLGYTGAVY